MGLDSNDRACLTKMFIVRNNWTHLKTDLPDKKELQDDLDTIKQFIKVINCSKQTEESNFLELVNKMKI